MDGQNHVSPNCDVLIIANFDDGKVWSEYLHERLKGEVRTSEGPERKIVTRTDSELANINRDPDLMELAKQAKVLLLIITPGLRDYVWADSSVSLAGVCEVPLTIFIFCGTDHIEFRDHTEQLPNVETAKVFAICEDEEKSQKTVSDVVKLVRLHFERGLTTETMKIFPESGQAQTPNTVNLWFEKKRRANTTITVEFLVDGVPKVFPTSQINPCTFNFVIPAGLVGVLNLVFRNGSGTLLGSRLFRNYSYGEGNALAAIYLDLLDSTLSTVPKSQVAKIDNTMRQTLKQITTSPVLFDGCRSFEGTKFPVKVPTLLHLAAKHNLKETTSKLVSWDGCDEACSVKNVDRKVPCQLAAENKHKDLEAFLSDIAGQSVDEGRIYEIMGIRRGDQADYAYMDMERNLNGYLDLLNDSECAVMPEDVESIIKHKYYNDPKKKKSEAIYYSSVDDDKSHPDESETQPLEGATGGNGTASGADQPGRAFSVIIDQLKAGKIDMHEAEVKLREWKKKHMGDDSESFKDKQEKMAQMRKAYRSVELKHKQKPVISRPVKVDKQGGATNGATEGYDNNKDFTPDDAHDIVEVYSCVDDDDDELPPGPAPCPPPPPIPPRKKPGKTKKGQ